MLIPILFLIIFFAILYYTSRYWKPKLLRFLKSYPYQSDVRDRIIIGEPVNKPSYMPRFNFRPLGIQLDAEEDPSSESCLICGRSSASGGLVRCVSPRCNRVYHSKCLSWMKQRGRSRCSCGTRLP